MTDDDPIQKLRDMLDRVAAVRMPTVIRRGRPNEEYEGGFEPLGPSEKISQLESYLLLTAEARQLAESARIAASDSLFDLNREWDDLEGWEMYLNGSTSKATGPQIEAAKRRVSPALHSKRQRLDWLVRRFSEQVRRLEQDDEVASRVYTLIVGG